MRQINILTVVTLMTVLGLAACDSRVVTTSVVPTPMSIIPTATPLPTATTTATLSPTQTPTSTPTQTLTAIPVATPCPAPTPGGPVGQIVFSAVPCTEAGTDCELTESSMGNLYIINSDGTGLRQLMAGVGAGLSLSPDGKKLAFTAAREDVEYVYFRSHLYVWDIATGEVQPLMADLPDESSSQAHWFPDGSRLAYVSAVVDGRGTMLHNSQSDLYIVRADGTNRTKVIERPARTGIRGDDVAISPNGSQIAFIGNEFDTGRISVFCVNTDGSNLRELMTLSPSAYFADLFWSPDGSEIFIADRLVDNPSSFVVRADGTTAPTEMTQIPGYITGWRWAADSVVEVSVCERNVGTSVWAMRTNSSDLRRVSEIPGECLQASNRWSSDGAQVAFHRNEPPEPPERYGLYVLDVNSGCERQILEEYYVIDLLWLPADVAVP